MFLISRILYNKELFKSIQNFLNLPIYLHALDTNAKILMNLICQRRPHKTCTAFFLVTNNVPLKVEIILKHCVYQVHLTEWICPS